MKSYFRFLWRNKLYTAIEVVGLGIALAFLNIIILFVTEQLSYDRNLKNTEDIYVGHNEEGIRTSYPNASLIENSFPEVRSSCAFVAYPYIDVIQGDDSFTPKTIIADNNFFEFFSFPFVQGEREGCLESGDAVVISESLSQRLFSSTEVLGQKIRLKINDSQSELFVTGVFEDISHSVFNKFDIVCPMAYIKQVYPELIMSGNGTAALTFKVVDGADIDSLGSKALELLKKNDPIYGSGLIKEFMFAPFDEIKYGVCDSMYPFAYPVNQEIVRIFIGAGLLLLVFALLNYISLTVSQMGFRAREMSTRRLLGEQKSEILIRYIKEAFVLCIISFATSFLFIELLKPFFETVASRSISIMGSANIFGVIFIVLLMIVVGLLSGTIPAMIVSRYSLTSKMTLGKIFIGIQNFVTITTLCITVAIFFQFRSVVTRDRGFATDGVIILEGRYPASVTEDIRRFSFVENVGGVDAPALSTNRSSMGCWYKGERVVVEPLYGNKDGFDIHGFNILWDNHKPFTKNSIWLTDGARRALSLELDAQSVEISNTLYEICGVIADFQRGDRSLEESSAANVIWFNVPENESLASMIIKVNCDENQAIKIFKSELSDFGEQKWDFYSSEDFIEKGINGSMLKNLKLLSLFALLMLLLCGMALLAISTYYAKQTGKNYSVKKVFGCSRARIYSEMVGGFMKVVLCNSVLQILLNN